ncbi:MAG: 30S ribosomal protein S4e [Nanoarchaeota archaeon]|nr:30S ribosomal protein S4e [Nanoarchaeota archaeon]
MGNHLKSLAAPKSWPIPRKRFVFITKQHPGPHTLETSMPLSVVLRDVVKVLFLAREMKKIVAAGKVLVNGVVRKELKFPVGIFDTISIPDADVHVRLVYNPFGQFSVAKVKKDRVAAHYVKILGKTIVKGGKVQLNFFDGSNMLVAKDDFKVGDTLVLYDGKVKQHLPFAKGALMYLVAGKHMGKTGSLEEVYTFNGSQPDRVLLGAGKEKLDTLRSYAFVIDKEFEHE